MGQSFPSLAAIAKGRVAAAKIFRMIDHKSGIDRNNETGLELDSVTGQVELKDVDFCYPSRPDNQILHNFTLTVPAGKTIALVGSSGSGKSTVVSLIERFYDPTSGISLSCQAYYRWPVRYCFNVASLMTKLLYEFHYFFLTAELYVFFSSCTPCVLWNRNRTSVND